MTNLQRIENDKIFTYDSSRNCYLFEESVLQKEVRLENEARLAKKERERDYEEFQEKLSDYEEEKKFTKEWLEYCEENEDADIEEFREIYNEKLASE